MPIREEDLTDLRPGDGVRFRKRRVSLWEFGAVTSVGTCCGEWCARVATEDGGRMHLFPALGDEIERSSS